MKSRMLWMAVLILACVFTQLPAQQKRPKVTMMPLAGPVHLLTGDGNIGVVADPAGLLMIDAMEEPVAAEIRAAVRPLPGGDHARILVNTHWHGDHTDGNKVFGPGAAIIAHENVRPLLAEDQTIMGEKSPALPAAALPDITYSDRLTVYAGGETIRLVHYPRAHTGGDTVVFFDRLKIVHMGDMFFNGMFPFLDVDKGGDIDGWVRQLDAILHELPPDAKVIPGHGPLASPAELRAFRDMLHDSAEVVRGRMKEGKTLQQIQSEGLPERFAPWTKGFLSTPRWLEMVYRSLEKHKQP